MWDNTLFTSRSVNEVLQASAFSVCAHVCVCVCECDRVLRRALSLLPHGHAGWTSEAFLSLCISIIYSAFPFCQSVFQPPVTSFFFAQTHTLTHILYLSLSGSHRFFFLFFFFYLTCTRLHTGLWQSITHSRSCLDETGEASHVTEIASLQASSLTCRKQSKVWHFHCYDELPTKCSSQVLCDLKLTIYVWCVYLRIFFKLMRENTKATSIFATFWPVGTKVSVEKSAISSIKDMV